MNTFNELQTALNRTLGFSEKLRFQEDDRKDAINQALQIIYGVLTDNNIIRKTTTITCAPTGDPTLGDGVADLPADFLEGTILYVGDTNDYDSSDEIIEVDAQTFGRYTSSDQYVCFQDYDADGELKLYFKGISSGTFYFEYERGAPILTDANQLDGLPKGTKKATAKVAAAILESDIMSNEGKMQVMLYGPSGDRSRFTPDSVMGILNRVMKKRKRQPQRGRIMQSSIIENRRRYLTKRR